MINLVIPMAGEGKRFVDAGYVDPKPFIAVNGRTMIQLVVENIVSRLVLSKQIRLVLLVRKEHISRAKLLSFDNCPQVAEVRIVSVEELTQGAACTVLLARDIIDSFEPLVIANSDQIVKGFNLNTALSLLGPRDSGIVTFEDKTRNSKWSYVLFNADAEVCSTIEKNALSTTATAGIYLFRHGKAFVTAAEDMIAADDRTNGEFYVCPVFNYLIARGGEVGIYSVLPSHMKGLGTPEDLQKFLGE